MPSNLRWILIFSARHKGQEVGFFVSRRKEPTLVENAVEASRCTEQDDYLGLPETSDDMSIETFEGCISN